MPFTKKDIELLKVIANIRGYVISDVKTPGKLPSFKKDKGAKAKTWILLNLQVWCKQRGLTLKEEYMFHPKRRWRSDWLIEERKILIEYDGLFSNKSGHTTPQGFTGDADKHNAAQQLSYKVYRFTALNYKNLLTVLNAVYE